MPIKNNLEGELRIIKADSFFSRAFGLLFKKRLERGQALHLKPCNSVHTIGMHYPIDLIFLRGDQTILTIHRRVHGFRFRWCAGGSSVLEMLAGEADRLELHCGMKLNESNGKFT
jgi:uncharacterized protein